MRTPRYVGGEVAGIAGRAIKFGPSLPTNPCMVSPHLSSTEV